MTERPRIDLLSDTQTRPSRPMREAMASAEVGDEQLGEDPSVRTLCAMVADLLGKEDALFLPSGTMCNEVAYRAHTQPGDEIILHETSHAVHYEVGGPAALSGVTLRTLPGERGIFTAAQVRSAVRDGAPSVRAWSPLRTPPTSAAARFGPSTRWRRWRTRPANRVWRRTWTAPA